MVNEYGIILVDSLGYLLREVSVDISRNRDLTYSGVAVSEESSGSPGVMFGMTNSVSCRAGEYSRTAAAESDSLKSKLAPLIAG